MIIPNAGKIDKIRKSIEEINVSRQSRPEKMKISPWPPENIRGIAPYETVKEICDAFAFALYAELPEEHRERLCYHLLRAAGIVMDKYPEIVEALVNGRIPGQNER